VENRAILADMRKKRKHKKKNLSKCILLVPARTFALLQVRKKYN
jgi:hypothetical protein